jgi:hypothetical protein
VLHRFGCIGIAGCAFLTIFFLPYQPNIGLAVKLAGLRARDAYKVLQSKQVVGTMAHGRTILSDHHVTGLVLGLDCGQGRPGQYYQ